jgi:hypothetical protein
VEVLADLVDNSGIQPDGVGLFIGLSRSGHLPGDASGAKDEIKLRKSWNLPRSLFSFYSPCCCFAVIVLVDQTRLTIERLYEMCCSRSRIIHSPDVACSIYMLLCGSAARPACSEEGLQEPRVATLMIHLVLNSTMLYCFWIVSLNFCGLYSPTIPVVQFLSSEAVQIDELSDSHASGPSHRSEGCRLKKEGVPFATKWAITTEAVGFQVHLDRFSSKGGVMDNKFQDYVV